MGSEKITVAAGEFDAMRVEVVSYYQGEEVGSRGGSGQSKETIWYAPAVNNFVKLEYQDTNWQGTIYNRDKWELTAFTRKELSTAGLPPSLARAPNWLPG